MIHLETACPTRGTRISSIVLSGQNGSLPSVVGLPNVRATLLVAVLEPLDGTAIPCSPMHGRHREERGCLQRPTPEPRGRASRALLRVTAIGPWQD